MRKTYGKWRTWIWNPNLDFLSNPFLSRSQLLEIPSGAGGISSFQLTRFRTLHIVAGRFLKSSGKVWSVIVNQNSTLEKNAFVSLQRDTESKSITGRGYPNIEAIADVLKLVYDATVQFQLATVPLVRQIVLYLSFAYRGLGKSNEARTLHVITTI